MTEPAKDRTSYRELVAARAIEAGAAALARCQQTERQRLAMSNRRAAAALERRLASAAQDYDELLRRIEECRQLRASDNCPGECVISGRPHTERRRY